MRRVMLALLGAATAFATLVLWLELGREAERTLLEATCVFFGVPAVGIPTLYYWRRNRLWNIWRCIVLGTLGGGLCALPFSDGPFAFPFLLAIFFVAGGLIGLLLWLVAVWRNDDLTCPKTFCLPCGMVYRFARNALRRHRYQPQSK